MGLAQEDKSEPTLAELETSYNLLKNMNLQETAEFPVIAYGLAEIFAYQEKYQQAVNKMEEALKYADHAIGVPDDFRSSIFLELSNYHSKLSQILQSIRYLESSLDEWEKLNGKINFTYFDRNMTLGKRYLLAQNYDKSLERHEIGLKLLDSLDAFDYVLYYGIVKSYVGDALYHKGGNYKAALSNYLEVLDHYGSDTHNFIYTDILSKVANCHRFLGNYPEANNYFEQSLQIKRDLELDRDPEYAYTMLHYGNSLESMGYCQEALEIHLSAFELAEELVAPHDSVWGNFHRAIAQDYKCLGNLKSAILNMEKAIDIYERNDQTDNPNYSAFLNSLALLYSQNGDQERAISLLEKSLELVKARFGDEDPDFGIQAMNLGYMQDPSNLEKKLHYYLMAEENFKVSLSPDNPVLGDFYSNFASLHIEMGNLETAEEMIEKGLDIIGQNSLGEGDTTFDALQLVKSELLANQNKIDQAISVLTEVIRSFENRYGKDNPILATHIFKLALYHTANQDFNKALLIYNRANDLFKEKLKRVFTYRSEAEKRLVVADQKNWQSFYYSFLNSDVFLSDELISEIFNDHLMRKGLLLNASKDILGRLSSLRDTVIEEKINEFRSLKRELTNDMRKAFVGEIDDQGDLRKKINKMENELVNLYYEKFNDQDLFDRKWQDIHEALSPGEMVIDFVHYNNIIGSNRSIEKSPVQYVAFMLSAEWDKPKMAPLFLENELKELLQSKSPNQIYASRGAVSKNIGDVGGVYDLIWKPLEPYLKGIRSVYYSPSGLLNQMPFAAIGPANGPLLSSDFDLVQLSNTYILAQKRSEPNFDRSVFVGGVDYEAAENASQWGEKSTADRNPIYQIKGTRSMGESWSYLPGTLKEIDAVGSMFSKNGYDFTKWTGTEASETKFKMLSGNSPQLIHLATHGFFFENPGKRQTTIEDIMKENTFKYAEDPLLRSGLILAGANQAWQYGIIPNDKEDGVLTALEIANMDLSNTDLVVLSACETGLGDIDGSEGVYGLQRAFKMAGVDMIIMSLWQVPDKETAEFMTLFYENWLDGKEVRSAFNQTQKTMQQHYKDEPLKWAAFVLFE